MVLKVTSALLRHFNGNLLSNVSSVSSEKPPAAVFGCSCCWQKLYPSCLNVHSHNRTRKPEMVCVYVCIGFLKPFCGIYVHFLRRSSYDTSRVRSLHDDIWENQVERRLANPNHRWHCGFGTHQNCPGSLRQTTRRMKKFGPMNALVPERARVFSSRLLCHHFSVQQQDQCMGRM